MSKRKTNEQFLLELKQINADIIPDEPYINAATRIKCHCAKCGYSWPATPNTLLSGAGCSKCAGNLKKSDSEFRKQLEQVNPNVEPLEEYQNRNTPIMCRCRQCGHEWPVKPANLLMGKGCKKCADKQRGISRRMSNEDFVRKLSHINPNIEPLEPYVESQTYIKCRCKKCGHIWPVYPNNLLTKQSGCPKCSNAETSIIEQIITRAFSIVLGESSVISRDRTAIKKELDVYIPDLKLAIEFGAWVWHKDKVKNDNEKQRRCKEKGIHLITIYERCPEIINEQLLGNYQVYTDNLSSEKDFRTTKKIIMGIFDDYGLSFSKIEREWSRIVDESIRAAQRRTEEDFKKLLMKKLPSITVIGDYKRADGRVKCKCTVCGHIWSPYASSLLQGHGCSKCMHAENGKKRKYTNEEFVRKLFDVNPNIEPLEPYVDSKTHIKCRCKKCGHIWPAKPNNLLYGKGCKKCASKRVNESRQRAVRCIETGICYSSISEATQKTGAYNIWKCAMGKQQTAGKCHWEFVD